MAENKDFSMSDKQTYEMIKELSNKSETRNEKIKEKLNLLTQEVRKNNHIKDAVADNNAKIDDLAEKVNCNTKNISDISATEKGEQNNRESILYIITALSLVVAILSNIGWI